MKQRIQYSVSSNTDQRANGLPESCSKKKQKRKEKNRKAETDTGAQLSDLNKLESQVLGITSLGNHRCQDSHYEINQHFRQRNPQNLSLWCINWHCKKFKTVVQFFKIVINSGKSKYLRTRIVCQELITYPMGTMFWV